MLFTRFMLLRSGSDTCLNESITRFHRTAKNYHLWTVVISVRDCEIKTNGYYVSAWEITIEGKNKYIGIESFDDFVNDLITHLSKELNHSTPRLVA